MSIYPALLNPLGSIIVCLHTLPSLPQPPK